MSLSDRFIRNPVLTTVCSLVILLIGGVAIPLLPLEKLPQLAPTQIVDSALADEAACPPWADDGGGCTHHGDW